MYNTDNDRDANLFFFGGRTNELVTGLTADIVADTIVGKPLPSVIVGGRSKEGRPAKWASVVPSVLTDRPIFNRRGKIIRGSIIEQELPTRKKRNVIVSHKEGNDWYVLVRTGFRVGQQGMMGDLMDIMQNGDIKEHGSFSLDKGSAAFKIAEGRSELADFGRNEAVRMWTSKGWKIPLLNMANSEYSLWKVPVGAIVIVRDVTGKLTRLVATKLKVTPVDAEGYDKFFDILLGTDREVRQQQARKPKQVVDADDAARQ